jgi:hypothetical protein
MLDASRRFESTITELREEMLDRKAPKSRKPSDD